jgi:cytochrome c5
MLRSTLVLFPAVLLACAAQQDGDCDSAVKHVTDCYGDEIGAAFAETCDPAAASAALGEQCVGDDGKADSFTTPILSPPVEQFKYGSIGSDKLGLPLVLIKALPIVCADLLPPGTDPRKEPLSAFGMIYEPGHDLPIGFSSHRLPIIGTTLVGNTCSGCHTSTVRETPTSQRTMYFGAPAIRFDLERYNNFLFSCISDKSRFNSTTLNHAFDQLGVHGIDRMLAYSTSLIRPFVANLETKVDSVVRDGAWGPGRDDAIGLSGAILLGPEFLPTVPAPVDFPAVWNQQERKTHSLHWDGAAGSALERNVLVSVGAGTPKSAVPLQSIGAIQSWLDALPAPRYPFAIDQTQVARGAQVFDERCASCHGPTGARTWSVVSLAEVGTDPNRVDSVTVAGINKINSLSGAGWQFDNFKKTDGYLTNLLDGIWLRAPYLHNGSVPTMRALLDAPAQRPTTFYRGNDTYNQNDMGFVSTVASEGNVTYVQFDTSRAGNSNAGHSGAAYGTDMLESDKNALLEYLKTL